MMLRQMHYDVLEEERFRIGYIQDGLVYLSPIHRLIKKYKIREDEISEEEAIWESEFVDKMIADDRGKWNDFLEQIKAANTADEFVASVYDFYDKGGWEDLPDVLVEPRSRCEQYIAEDGKMDSFDGSLLFYI